MRGGVGLVSSVGGRGREGGRENFIVTEARVMHEVLVCAPSFLCQITVACRKTTPSGSHTLSLSLSLPSSLPPSLPPFS